MGGNKPASITACIEHPDRHMVFINAHTPALIQGMKIHTQEMDLIRGLIFLKDNSTVPNNRFCHTNLDLVAVACGDVGDGPARFLADPLLRACQQPQQARQRREVDDHLRLQVVAGDNVANGAERRGLHRGAGKQTEDGSRHRAVTVKKSGGGWVSYLLVREEATKKTSNTNPEHHQHTSRRHLNSQPAAVVLPRVHEELHESAPHPSFDHCLDLVVGPVRQVAQSPASIRQHVVVLHGKER